MRRHATRYNSPVAAAAVAVARRFMGRMIAPALGRSAARPAHFTSHVRTEITRPSTARAKETAGEGQGVRLAEVGKRVGIGGARLGIAAGGNRLIGPGTASTVAMAAVAPMAARLGRTVGTVVAARPAVASPGHAADFPSGRTRPALVAPALRAGRIGSIVAQASARPALSSVTAPMAAAPSAHDRPGPAMAAAQGRDWQLSPEMATMPKAPAPPALSGHPEGGSEIARLIRQAIEDALS